MCDTITYVFSGSFEPAGFAGFVRRRAALLDIRATIHESAPTRFTIEAAGQTDLLDAFEMACSLGPPDALIRDVTTRRSGG